MKYKVGAFVTIKNSVWPEINGRKGIVVFLADESFKNTTQYTDEGEEVKNCVYVIALVDYLPKVGVHTLQMMLPEDTLTEIPPCDIGLEDTNSQECEEECDSCKEHGNVGKTRSIEAFKKLIDKISGDVSDLPTLEDLFGTKKDKDDNGTRH